MPTLSRNVLYNIVGQAVVSVLGFVAVKYVFSSLGDHALGLIYFTLTANTILTTVVSQGLSATVIREVAARYADERDYVIALIRTVSLVCWITYAVLAGVVSVSASFVVGRWIHLGTLEPTTSVFVVQILGAGALTALPRSLYSSIVVGMQRLDVSNAVDVAAVGLQQAGVVAILFAGGTIFEVVYWLAVSFGLWVLGYFVVLLRLFPPAALLPTFARVVLGRNLRFSGNILSTSLLHLILSQADKIIVSKLLPVSAFGYYA